MGMEKEKEKTPDQLLADFKRTRNEQLRAEKKALKLELEGPIKELEQAIEKEKLNPDGPDEIELARLEALLRPKEDELKNKTEVATTKYEVDLAEFAKKVGAREGTDNDAIIEDGKERLKELGVEYSNALDD